MRHKCKKEYVKSKIEIDEKGCWVWKGSVSNIGYGKALKKGIQAHKVSYEAFLGIVPKGLCVCHSCDNKLCVNPEHLWLGTQKENIQDCKEKGRLRNQKGDKNSMSKISEEQVIKIRESTKKYEEIAVEYGISISLISMIKTRKRWNWL